MHDCVYIIYKPYFKNTLNIYTYTCTEMYIQGKTNLSYRIMLYFTVSLIFIFVKLSSSEQVFFLFDKLKYFPTQPEENQVVHESII